MEVPREIQSLFRHVISVAIILGSDFLLKALLPPEDGGHIAGVWLRHVLDWGAVSLVVAILWIVLMTLLSVAIESTRDAAKKFAGFVRYVRQGK